MSLTINGATNTLTAASGLTIAGNTAVTGTLSASAGPAALLGNTAFAYKVPNTGSTIYNGIWFQGQTATDSFFGRKANSDNLIVAGANQTDAVWAEFSSAGLAVTGTLSATGIVSTTSTTGFSNVSGNSTYKAAFTGNIQQATLGSDGSTGAYVGTLDAYDFKILRNSSVIGTFSASGLAVTGTLSASGGMNVAGLTAPASGINLEMGITGGYALIQGYNRTTPGYIAIEEHSSSWTWKHNGSTSVLAATSTGLAVTGGVTASSTNGIFTATGTTGWSGLSVTKTGGNLTVGIDDGVTFGYTDGDGVIRYTSGKSLNILETSGATTASFSASAITANQNIVMASGKGIDFSATANGSGTTTSEVLSDYEEGTWTPVLEAENGTFGAITYNALHGARYTKIGNVVHIQGVLYTDSVAAGTATLEVRIGGLPFTAAASSGSTQDGFSSLAVSQSAGWVTNQPSGALVRANSKQIGLSHRTTANGASVNTTVADVTTGSAGNLIRFSGTYNV